MFAFEIQRDSQSMSFKTEAEMDMAAAVTCDELPALDILRNSQSKPLKSEAGKHIAAGDNCEANPWQAERTSVLANRGCPRHAATSYKDIQKPGISIYNVLQ